MIISMSDLSHLQELKHLIDKVSYKVPWKPDW